MRIFNLPDLGEGLAEAEIVRWHVNVGDVVAVDQPMLAVETAKAVVEVPAPFTGTIRLLHGKPGDVIATGAPLVEFEGNSDTGTVVGNMPTSDRELIETVQVGRRQAHVSKGNRLRAAPAARALARHLGVDLNTLTGSGRGGVIVVTDVIARAPTKTAAFEGGEKLRGLRRAMAQSMSLARDNVASCTIFDDADLHRWREGQDITIRVLRAIATGCQAEPALNAWFDGNSQTRRLLQKIDVGMAVDTPEGLIVPVVRDIANCTPAQLRLEVDRLKSAARDRTVTPEDLRDVTFILSNFGMIAGRYATPVVVPPMVAILGSGRLSRDVVAVQGGIEAHLRMPLSLTFDHRCVTGGEAARFLAAVLRDLEKDT
jgi:pyruvate dehydrogenase E2 component (dihydrolipoamide acetyltransferase)